MAGVPPNQRSTNMVFQTYVIFPHLSVTENVALGLRTHPDIENSTVVDAALDMVGLTGFGHRSPHELFRRTAAACCPCEGPYLKTKSIVT